MQTEASKRTPLVSISLPIATSFFSENLLFNRLYFNFLVRKTAHAKPPLFPYF
jgi:hypothetical protein